MNGPLFLVLFLFFLVVFSPEPSLADFQVRTSNASQTRSLVAGDYAWTYLEDTTCATSSSAASYILGDQGTHALDTRNFGFSLPVGATVMRIDVNWTGTLNRIPSSPGVLDKRASVLFYSSATGNTSEALATVLRPDSWTSSFGVSSYPRPGDDPLWGRTWTREEVNGPDFGASLALSTPNEIFLAGIKCVLVSVEYEVQTTSSSFTSSSFPSSSSSSSSFHTSSSIVPPSLPSETNVPSDSTPSSVSNNNNNTNTNTNISTKAIATTNYNETGLGSDSMVVESGSGAESGFDPILGYVIIGTIAAGLCALFGVVMWIGAASIRRRRRRGLDPGDLENVTLFDGTDGERDKPLMLERVRLDSKLGEGNYGVVYLGRWSGTDVACKTVKEGDDRADLEKEARTLQNLNLPSVVRVFGLTDIEDFLYIVMEYFPMGSLLEHLRNDRVVRSEADLDSLCVKASAGCMYIHGRGLIHRDLAARNFFVKEEAREIIVKIGDVGLSRFSATGTYSPVTSATSPIPIRWSAPEILKKSRTYTFKTDMWSLGVVLWEIYSEGRIPYEDMNNGAAIQAISKRTTTLDRPHKCPIYAFDVMERCWDKDPSLRPEASEVHAILDSGSSEINKVKKLRTSTKRKGAEEGVDDDDEDEQSFDGSGLAYHTLDSHPR